MKPKKRIRRLKREIRELRELRVAITTFTATRGAQTILDTTLGELLDGRADGSSAPISGVAARSPNVYLGPWRLV